MPLTERQVEQILRTYQNFCKVLQREKSITSKNFNRIITINNLLGKKENNASVNVNHNLAEIYQFLEKPEIKARLENSSNFQDSSILISKVNLEIVCITRQNSGKIVYFSNKKNFQQRYINRESLTRLKSLNTKKHKKNTVNCIRKNKANLSRKSNNMQCIKPMNKIEKKKNDWKIAQSKKEAIVRNKERVQKAQAVTHQPNAIPKCIFNESSIFNDIMDERKAEGKGYSGSK